MAAKKILLQKGHHAPMEPGHETQTGASGERETVGVLVDRLASLLNIDRRFHVQVIPGRIPPDVRDVKNVCDAFVAFHCDGSTDPRRGGWGVGYPPHPINRAFARTVATEIREFHRSPQLEDNYTANMSGYYAWNDIDIAGPELLVEHGFSSNPVERAWMVKNAGRFAEAYQNALVAWFKLADLPDPVHGAERREKLRAWILAARGIGWTWAKLKQTDEWKEWRRLGGT